MGEDLEIERIQLQEVLVGVSLVFAVFRYTGILPEACCYKRNRGAQSDGA